MSTKRDITDYAIVVSDMHVGCQLGLMRPGGARLDEGGAYTANAIQRKIWEMWDHFWRKWVPHITDRRRYDVIINGDTIEGVHHKSVTQWTSHLDAQAAHAERILRPIFERVHALGGRVYWIRGTEAHVGPSAQEEERLARALGATRNRVHQYARYDLWKRVGRGIIHALHHIGTTGSAQYESTAVHRELIEAYAEAGRWRERPPDAVVRSHRHRFLRTEIPAASGNAFGVTTPGWQAKTPFAYRIAGARQSTPQFGGLCVLQGEEGLYLRHKVWTIGRSELA